MRTTLATLALAAACAAGCPAASAAPFVHGDLYLASGSIGPVAGTRGIIRVSLANWQSSTLLLFAAGDFPQFRGRFAYDAARDRLVVPDTATSLALIDASGARTALPYVWTQTAGLIASGAQGRIYITSSAFGPATPTLAFIDAMGATHPALNAAGAAPYVLNLAIDAVLYDAPTNSLVVAIPATSPTIRLRRLALSADGARVTSDALETVTNVQSDGPRVVSLSRGPNGALFAKIDDNSSFERPRMVLINPADLAVSTFATNSYFGVGGETAGCYCPTAQGAVVLDTLNDVLRLYAHNATGEGVILPTTGVSFDGSSESAQLLLIDAPSCPGDANGDNHVDFIDLNIVLSNFGAVGAALAGDLDHDGDVDFVDLNIVLGAFGGAC